LEQCLLHLRMELVTALRPVLEMNKHCYALDPPDIRVVTGLLFLHKIFLTEFLVLMGNRLRRTYRQIMITTKLVLVNSETRQSHWEDIRRT